MNLLNFFPALIRLDYGGVTIAVKDLPLSGQYIVPSFVEKLTRSPPTAATPLTRMIS